MVRSIRHDSWTYDERLHLQSAIEWIQTGQTPSDPFNPPLSKIPVAGWYQLDPSIEFDPVLLGPRLLAVGWTLALVAVVWKWTQQQYGSQPALFAVLLLGLEPLTLAHGHLFTTDMPATFLFFVTVIAGYYWWEHPHQKIAQWGVWITLALLAVTKITAVPMVGVAWLVYWLATDRSWKRLWTRVQAGWGWPQLAAATLILWGAYKSQLHSPLPGTLPEIPIGGFLRTGLSASCFVFCDKYQATRSLSMGGMSLGLAGGVIRVWHLFSKQVCPSFPQLWLEWSSSEKNYSILRSSSCGRQS
jgi:4-amino-4-deoxy-L-arabinose transferase-like glycosyltransferase